MDSSAVFYFNVGEKEYNVQLMRIRRKIRDTSNPFDLPDVKFINYFRINQEGLHYLLEAISPYFKESIRATAVPPLLKICAALRFLASGSYQTCGGNDFNIVVSQPTFSLILGEVLHILETKMAKVWIKASMTDEEMAASKLAVYENSGFPGVVGFVDGTHVKIISPRQEEQHLYKSRKLYYSLNVLIFCDYKMRIRYVDARHPGANHDSHI